MSKTVQPPRRQARANGTARHKGRRLWVTTSAGAAVIAGAATIIAAIVTGVFTMVHTPSTPASTPTAAASVSPAPPLTSLPHSRIQGDKTTFIKDVTFPDNTIVAPAQRFIKKWE